MLAVYALAGLLVLLVFVAFPLWVYFGGTPPPPEGAAPVRGGPRGVVVAWIDARFPDEVTQRTAMSLDQIARRVVRLELHDGVAAVATIVRALGDDGVEMLPQLPLHGLISQEALAGSTGERLRGIAEGRPAAIEAESRELAAADLLRSEPALVAAALRGEATDDPGGPAALEAATALRAIALLAREATSGSLLLIPALPDDPERVLKEDLEPMDLVVGPLPAARVERLHDLDLAGATRIPLGAKRDVRRVLEEALEIDGLVEERVAGGRDDLTGCVLVWDGDSWSSLQDDVRAALGAGRDAAAERLAALDPARPEAAVVARALAGEAVASTGVAIEAALLARALCERPAPHGVFMAFLPVRRGERGWGPGYTQEERRALIDLVVAHHRSAGRRVRLGHGRIAVSTPDGDERFGLYSLAAVARTVGRAPRVEWPALVKRHFDAMAAGPALGEQTFEQVKDALAVVLRAPLDVDGVDETVHRTDLPGVVTRLVLDLPDSTTSVSSADARRWGKPEAELFDIGLANVRARFPVTSTRTHDVGGQGTEVQLLISDHVYGATHALFLAQDRPDLVGSFGLTLGIPDRFTVVSRRIDKDDPERVRAGLGAVVACTAALHDRSDSPVSAVTFISRGDGGWATATSGVPAGA